ncbi:hypothetical protein F5Y05DRAFT_407303 [Hypoxylon sp. FL0543]|nr:hypothetical protein F5Y05DRAFT_407303 [Hypoxylon sp. FL0543]
MPDQETAKTASTASSSKQTSAAQEQEQEQEQSHPSQQHEEPSTEATQAKTAPPPPKQDDCEDAEGDAEEPELYPGSIACPCPCHENTVQREGRPWLAFSNEAYLVCPLCWVDAYMTAHGDEKRLFDCEKYLRARGKDPKVPASKQC